MTTRWTTWLAVALWTASFALVVCMAALVYANDLSARQLLLSGFAVGIVAFISMGAVGTLLAVHRPGNPISWVFLIATLSASTTGLAELYAQYITETATGSMPDMTALLWLGAWTWVIAYYGLPTTGVLLFPTGRLPSPRWRLFAWLVATWLALMVLAEMFTPGPLHQAGKYPQFTNPIAIESLAWLFNIPLSYEVPALAITFLGAIASLVARLRVATGVERQQIKWFVYAAAIPMTGVAVSILLSTALDFDSETTDGVGGFIVVLGIACLPVAVGIAILRHNLYDIDRLINRTLVFGSLTAMLGLGFASSVILLQFLLSPLTGGSDLAVAGSTLLIAALFRPLRDRLQAFVDRKFYRRRYDAARTLAAFNARLRDDVDLLSLTSELGEVVRDTMQPAHLSVWIRPAPSREERA